MARRTLRDRLGDNSSHSFPPPKDEPKPLTPLQARLIGALRHVAEEYDELRMIVGGFERHMRKNPYTDEEIASTLTTVRQHIDLILQDEPKTHTA